MVLVALGGCFEAESPSHVRFAAAPRASGSGPCTSSMRSGWRSWRPRPEHPDRWGRARSFCGPAGANWGARGRWARVESRPTARWAPAEDRSMSTATTTGASTAPGLSTHDVHSGRPQAGAPPAACPGRLSHGKGHLAVDCPRRVDACRARSTTRSRCVDEDRRGAVRWRRRCRAEGTGRLVDLAARTRRADHHRPGQPPPLAAPARAASGAAAGGPMGLQRLSFGKGHLAAFTPAERRSAESGGLPAHFGPTWLDERPKTALTRIW